MNDHHIQLEVVCEETGLIALRREWDALWQKAHGRYYQRHDLCMLAWRHVAQPRARKLHCIVIREHGELRLVWPLVSWRRWFWIYLLPLSPDAADYTSVLVEDGPRAAMFIEHAWKATLERCRADFIHLPFMNEGSELHRIALREPRVLGSTRHESWIAKLRGEGDWKTFCGSLGTLHGKKPGQLERRLAKEGRLVVKHMETADREGIAQCIGTMLAWKRQWSDRVGKKGTWLYMPHYERFLTGTVTEGLAHMIVVSLDDKPVAVAVMSHGNPLANAVIAGFDPSLGRLGPGTVAWEHAVKWAFEQGYDIDFGAGSERFKGYWSRDNRGHAWTMQIANTVWGLVGYRAVRAVKDGVDFVRGERASEGVSRKG
jgi:CelD/BcsL family acetyltransferase involved in cellulose biosynthesis